MLGKNVRISVTNKIGSPLRDGSGTYLLNFGQIVNNDNLPSSLLGVVVMGIDHPVGVFDGRAIAYVKFDDDGTIILIASPKSKRYIDYNIKSSVSFLTKGRSFTLECLYEHSCGAVVFRIINGTPRFLLIRNKRSANWGFPKGHMEFGETPEQTARREVLEETGIHIDILPNFVCKSDYTIQGKIEKTVTIYLASTKDTQTIIQREEIEEYIWLRFEDALDTVKFENDRSTLINAHKYLTENKLIPKD